MDDTLFGSADYAVRRSGYLSIVAYLLAVQFSGGVLLFSKEVSSMSPQAPPSIVRGELLTELVFLEELLLPISPEESRKRFFARLAETKEYVPLFGHSSASWDEYLQESRDAGYASGTDVIQLTRSGKARLSTLRTEAAKSDVTIPS